jgi:Tol biopolymer transport system component
MRIHRAAIALIMGASVLATPAVATAAYPGSNGRIAFEQGGFIYSIRPDGSDRRQLTTDTLSRSPRYSPDGRSIAFHRAGDIWVMKADGSGARRVTNGAAKDFSPSWSPDGRRLVFSRTTDGTIAGRSLYVVPVAGGNAARLTSKPDGCALEPTWSADGRFVVYWDSCAGGATSTGDAIRKVDIGTGRISSVVGVDGLAQPGGRVFFLGTGPDVTPDGHRVVFTAVNTSDSCGVAITDLSGGGFRFITAQVDCVFASDDPAVSPDGKKVVYTAGNENPQLDVARTAGSDQCCNAIYESGTNDFPTRPDWQPLP